MRLSRLLTGTSLAVCVTAVLAFAGTGGAFASPAAGAHSTAATVTNAGAVTPDINKVTCGSRTDWFRLWTAYHGFPACYANSGDKYLAGGLNPPNDTWTTYGYCSGNNAGDIYYYTWDAGWGTWDFHDVAFTKWHCNDFTSTVGRTVEVYRIYIRP
jgi:hypothetical protein